jgi:hypothetical protein
VSVSLTTLGGKPAVEIVAPDGEVKTYRLEWCHGAGVWRCVLWYCAEGGYTVEERGGRWSCSCRAFQFNPDRFVTGCKHCIAMKELRAALEALAPGGTAPAGTR